MTKELTKKEDTAIANFDDNAFADIGPDQDLTANDIQIPKLLLMQGQSPQVLDGKAKFGELVDTQSWEKFASFDEGVVFIPFHWRKAWIYKTKDGDKWKFHSIADVDRHNEKDDMYEEWVDKETNKLMKRVYTHFFLGLVPGESTPYSVAFRGGSKKHGDALVTQMYVTNRNLKVDEAYKRSPMAKAIKLQPNKTTNKSGDTFAELLISVERDATKEEALDALNWYKSVQSGEAKADYTDHEEEAKTGNNNVPDDVQF
jgi:hypothetical protein